MERDPVCGMEGKKGITAVKGGKKYYFCSENCKNKFLGKEVKKPKEEHENRVW